MMSVIEMMTAKISRGHPCNDLQDPRGRVVSDAFVRTLARASPGAGVPSLRQGHSQCEGAAFSDAGAFSLHRADGVGHFMADAYRTLRTADIYSSITTISLIGFALDRVFPLARGWLLAESAAEGGSAVRAR
jgi:hypothetical protein